VNVRQAWPVLLALLVLAPPLVVLLLERPSDSEPRANAVTARLGRLPTDIAASEGRLIVAHAGENWIASVPERGSLASQILRFGSPQLRVAARGPDVWATGTATDSVLGVELRAGALLKELRVGRDAVDVAIGEDALWVTNGASGTVTRVDPVSGRRVGRPIRTGRFPSAVATGQRYVWVVNAGDGTVARVDPREHVVIGRRLPVGREPQDIAVGLGSVWVADRGDGTVVQLSADTGRRQDVIDVGGAPSALALTADAVLVLDPSGRRVVRIAPRSGAVDVVAKLQGYPTAIAVDGSGAAWVADTRSGTLTRVTPTQPGAG
jgi:streptogramin lyase